MPGLAAAVADEIAALERPAGPEAIQLIRREADETIARIVAGWPQAFDTKRALSLGFVPDADFDSIIRTYIEDEMNQRPR